jgi:hypothetical protein
LFGEKYYDGMEYVDFDDVTINLTGFYLGDFISFKNGTFKPNVNQLPEVTYSGFFVGSLVKCFGLEMRDKQMKDGFFGFNSSRFSNGVRPHGQEPNETSLVTFIHLPKQALLSGDTQKFSWPKRTMKKEFEMHFDLGPPQVLKRRNKRTEACISDFVNYDNHLLNSQIEKIGCKAPYQKTERNFSICSSKESMKLAVMDINGYMGNSDFLTNPCTSMTDIRYRFSEMDMPLYGSLDCFWITIKLPNTFMEVVQVKAVDFQTVIGNAGGYVGLFLGK